MSLQQSDIIEAIIQTPDHASPIQIFGLHPGSPRSETLWKLRNLTLEYISEKFSHSLLPNKILVGDFNTSPWSPEFKNMEKISAAKNSAHGFGYIPSWSLTNLNGLLRFISSAYIDHCLVSDTFTVINKQHFKINGTDHLLISTTLGIKI